MSATAWLMSFSSCIVCGFDSYTLLFQVSPEKIVECCKVRRKWRPQIFANRSFLREDVMNSLQGHPRSVAYRPVLLEEKALSFSVI